MLTFLFVFLITFLVFAFFLYNFAWNNRYSTQIRLAVSEKGGRVISIKRAVRIKKKFRAASQQEKPPGIFTFKNVEWKVVYKDRFDALCEARCRLARGKFYWHPPLQ